MSPIFTITTLDDVSDYLMDLSLFLEHMLACCAGISLQCLHYLLSLQNHHQHHHHHHHHADAGAGVQFPALLLILPQRHT